jgi:hypothetical protein
MLIHEAKNECHEHLHAVAHGCKVSFILFLCKINYSVGLHNINSGSSVELRHSKPTNNFRQENTAVGVTPLNTFNLKEYWNFEL